MKIGPFDVPGYYVGDAREMLRQLPDASVNCCVTSPPYWGLRDYGVAGQLGLEETPAAFVAALVAVFREVRRVLRDDGTLWLNLGDSYAGSWGAQGRSGEMAARAIVSARQVEAHPKKATRTGAIPPGSGLKQKDLVGIPWMVAFALRADGWWLRSDIIWSKPNPMPESVTDRPTKAHEYVFLLAKSASYYYDAAAIKEPSTYPDDNRKARQKPADYAAQMSDTGQIRAVINPAGAKTYPDRNRRTVWEIATEPTPDAHFATYPTKLIEPCILAGCPAGGIVLDPFGGSGTTGRVAEDHGRRWILFDLNPEYAAIAKRRTAQTGLLGRAVGAQV